MKAKEIRDSAYVAHSDVMSVNDRSDWGMKTAEYTMQACFEIAAQLAEANEHLAKIANPLITVEESPWVEFPVLWGVDRTDKMVVDRRSVTAVTPRIDARVCAISHDGMQTVVDQPYVDVCRKLRIPVGE